MIRLLNLVAIACLIASAIYAYTIKYQTMFRAETVASLKAEIRQEQDRIGLLRAEWANLSRPERVEALSDKLLSLQPLQLNQIVKPEALPSKLQREDMIGRKLATLGLGEPTNTPDDSESDGATPSSGKQGRAR